MDVIIVGAGAAGLTAAKILSAKKINVVVLEARERLGGRIHSIENTFTINAEAGAEFIHGNLKVTKQLLEEAGLKQIKVEGGLYRMENGSLKKEEDSVEGWGMLTKRLKKLTKDIPVSEFLEMYFMEEKDTGIRESFKKYIQGYDAADIQDASAISIREEMEIEDDEQYRVEKGYGALIGFLAEESKKNGCLVKISTIVKQVNWQKNFVEVISNNETFKAQKVIITVPVGVLKASENDNGAIKFYPEIPEQQKEINNIGFGKVVKILLEFDENFWLNKNFLKKKHINNPFFFFADTFIPTWWTQHPGNAPLLVGWLAGPAAGKYSYLNEDEFLAKSIVSLADIFGINQQVLYKKLKVHKIYNWVSDPFCRGAYSYATLNTKRAINILKEPLSDTIYFAGEAFGKSGTATVDAAFQSGHEVAELILSQQ